jgi:hypothetical protein
MKFLMKTRYVRSVPCYARACLTAAGAIVDRVTPMGASRLARKKGRLHE